MHLRSYAVSFEAIVFTTLGVVILVLIALGLWSRRRPSDIWEESVVRSSAARASIEQRDVEEILGGEWADAGPVPTQDDQEVPTPKEKPAKTVKVKSKAA
jgi:hypothetical protein